MTIPTEPIGSIPRPPALLAAMATRDGADPALKPLYEEAVRQEVRDRTLQAAKYIPIEQLGTTGDCGFSPFCDDTSTSRGTAFAKIEARVLGTRLAADMIGGR